MRERVYKLAIALTVLFLVDGLLNAVALQAGGYARLGYGQISLLPIFIPALLAAIVVTGIYIHGFTRRSWTVRTADRVFFVVFAVAVAAKMLQGIYGE